MQTKIYDTNRTRIVTGRLTDSLTYTQTQTHTHTRTFNSLLSRTTRVNRYQKGKTNLDFTEARESGWQWHQLGHMQVCTSLQTDNHASTPPLSFNRPDALPATQPTASKHSRHKHTKHVKIITYSHTNYFSFIKQSSIGT